MITTWLPAQGTAISDCSGTKQSTSLIASPLPSNQHQQQGRKVLKYYSTAGKTRIFYQVHLTSINIRESRMFSHGKKTLQANNQINRLTFL